MGSVDRAARGIQLGRTKNGEPRSLPLDEEDWKLIEGLWPARASDRRFRLTCSIETGSLSTVTVLGKQWRKACIAAGLGHRDEKGRYNGKLFHDLRRSGVRDMIRSGVSQHVAMAISGHATEAVFRRYNITSADDKREAMARRRQYVETRTESGSSVVPIRTPTRT